MYENMNVANIVSKAIFVLLPNKKTIMQISIKMCKKLVRAMNSCTCTKRYLSKFPSVSVFVSYVPFYSFYVLYEIHRLYILF